MSLTCAPVKRIGRDEIYRACELRDGKNNNDSVSACLTHFARGLMTDHLSHYHAVVRNESLVALRPEVVLITYILYYNTHYHYTWVGSHFNNTVCLSVLL